MELNLVEFWLRRDPVRWRAGAVGGVIAAFVAVLVAMFMGMRAGMEVWFPVKVAAAALLGPEATQYGLYWLPILIGAGAIAVLSSFLGFVFAHFVWSNSLRVLFPMGLVWGLFSWIFIWNLFLQSVKAVAALRLSSGVVFFVCMVFGLGLLGIAPLDRLFEKLSADRSSRLRRPDFQTQCNTRELKRPADSP